MISKEAIKPYLGSGDDEKLLEEIAALHLSSTDLERLDKDKRLREPLKARMQETVQPELGDLLENAIGRPVPSDVIEQLKEGSSDAFVRWLVNEDIQPDFNEPNMELLPDYVKEILNGYANRYAELAAIENVMITVEGHAVIPPTVKEAYMSNGDISDVIVWIDPKNLPDKFLDMLQADRYISPPTKKAIREAVLEKQGRVSSFSTKKPAQESTDVMNTEKTTDVTTKEPTATYGTTDQEWTSSLSTEESTKTPADDATEKSRDETTKEAKDETAEKKEPNKLTLPEALELLFRNTVPSDIISSLETGTDNLTDWVAKNGIPTSWSEDSTAFKFLPENIQSALRAHAARSKELAAIEADVGDKIPSKAATKYLGSATDFTDVLAWLENQPNDGLSRLSEAEDLSDPIRSQISGLLGSGCRNSHWAEWTDCEDTCGRSQRRREWLTDDSESNCSKPAEVIPCYLPICDKDCTWSAWGVWGTCDAECEKQGIRHRYRLPSVPEANGTDCSGPYAEIEECAGSCEAVTHSPATVRELERANIDSDPIHESLAFSAALKDVIPFYLANKSEAEKLSYGHQLKDSVPLCTFDGKKCEDGDWRTFYDPALGNCFTFNYRYQPDIKYWVRRGGGGTGLHVLLHTETSEYMCVSQVAGFRVAVHNQSQRVFPDADGINIAPAKATILALQLTEINSLEPPYGTCKESPDSKFLYNGTYTTEIISEFEGCLRSCYQHELINSCECADPRYKVPSNVDPCSLGSKKCLDSNLTCLMADLETNAKSDCAQCSHPCRENFALLSVYHEGLSYLVLTEQPAMGKTQLMSDLAGVMGMLLGSSLITILEFAVFVADLIVFGVTTGENGLL